MLAAYHLARQVLPAYSSKFSRRDFTLHQLFACLVVREHQRQSYRGCEALLRDTDWWRAIGMPRVPDHNTLCRAFGAIVTGRVMNKALDVLAGWFSLARVLRLSSKPLALDTTCFESRHVSRPSERRRWAGGKGKGGCRRRGRPDARGSLTRRRSTRRLPKAGFAVATACHGILAARAATGAGADQRWLEPLLFQRGGGCPTAASGPPATAGSTPRTTTTSSAATWAWSRAHPARGGQEAQGREEAHRGPLAPRDEAAAADEAVAAPLRLHPAVAGRDRQQHGQAEPGLGPAGADPEAPRAGDDAAGGGAQRHAAVAPSQIRGSRQSRTFTFAAGNDKKA